MHLLFAASRVANFFPNRWLWFLLFSSNIFLLLEEKYCMWVPFDQIAISFLSINCFFLHSFLVVETVRLTNPCPSRIDLCFDSMADCDVLHQICRYSPRCVDGCYLCRWLSSYKSRWSEDNREKISTSPSMSRAFSWQTMRLKRSTHSPVLKLWWRWRSARKSWPWQNSCRTRTSAPTR